MSTVNDLEFAENVGDVIAYRLWTQDQDVGNLSVAFAIDNEGQHLSFALRQIGKGLLRDDRAHIREILHEALRNLWAKDRFPMSDPRHGTQHLHLTGAFENVPASACPHCSKDGVVVAEHSEHQDANVWAGL